jgi:hypothetical protein
VGHETSLIAPRPCGRIDVLQVSPPSEVVTALPSTLFPTSLPPTATHRFDETHDNPVSWSIRSGSQTPAQCAPPSVVVAVMAMVAWPSTEVPIARQWSLEEHTMEPSPEIDGGVTEAAVASGVPWWIVLAGGDTFAVVLQPATSSVIAAKITAVFDRNRPEPAGVAKPP